MTPNAQTPGPLQSVPADPLLIIDDNGMLYQLVRVSVAAVPRFDRIEADGRLFCAAFNALDRAGRALQVDAAELAENIDIAKLIQAAESVLSRATLEGADWADLHELQDALASLKRP